VKLLIELHNLPVAFWIYKKKQDYIMIDSTKLKKPPRLEPGDTIGLIAPASGVKDSERIDASVAFFEKEGYKVKLGEHARKVTDFLAGSDRERLDDLHTLWRDNSVKAIWCLRGGYGTLRLIDRLDYQLFYDTPKIFVGYSDITTLHLAMLVKSQLVTFHGPMAASDLSREELVRPCWEETRRLLSTPEPLGQIGQGLEDQLEVSSLGEERTVSGPLIGGNLALVQTSLGNFSEIDTERAIVFLEDIGESPYRLDRVLTHLVLSSKLTDAKGLALGIFNGCYADDDESAKNTNLPESLKKILLDRLGPLNLPTVYGLPLSHTPLNVTVPQGLQATLNTTDKTLSIDEAAVS
jgi:muramoyltetrapeptide carboxypeptidase